MARGENLPIEKHVPQNHISGELPESLADAIQRIIADQGSEYDWRNHFTVPRPRIWEKRLDIIGKTVIPHTCAAREHGGNNGCICDLLGKPVVIVRIWETEFVGTPSYEIEGSKKRIQEREFSDETKGKNPGIVEGFILENSKGKFLTAAFVWVSAESPLDGYLHNTQVVRDLLGREFLNGPPVKAYPASSRLDGSEKQIRGEAIPFGQRML
ncbi:MAG: hypothetical protein HZC04_01325 [Candidatus Lloydbacteria bacterium]|nr:hypothetical protein [Candidatus Lloydbacteria bacterium]